MCNNPNLDVVSINAYAKSGQIPSIQSLDIEWKQSRNDGVTDNLQPENSIHLSPPYFIRMRGYNYPWIRCSVSIGISDTYIHF